MIKIELKKVKVKEITELFELMSMLDLDYNIKIKSKKILKDYIKENQDLKKQIELLEKSN
ncbi:MAG: hypothetical protein MUO82_00790 [Candidatus Thermoplasmatota archaeon]|nr:hypothetical protein [Candidatus Thermoplasmatota archaeon]